MEMNMKRDRRITNDFIMKDNHVSYTKNNVVVIISRRVKSIFGDVRFLAGTKPSYGMCAHVRVFHSVRKMCEKS